MSYATRTSLLASTLVLLAPGPMALGQTPSRPVQMFEEAPSLEVLRNIVVPESRQGRERRIVLPSPDRAANDMSPAAYSAIPAPGAEPERRRAQTPPQATRGAPQPAAAPQQLAVVGFRINFALDSAEVPPSALPFIERIAELMRQEHGVQLQVEGHTDALGSDAYNRDLSFRRARAVTDALVVRGVPAQRLVAIGKGENEPLVQNTYDAGNRRVQFVRTE